MHSSLTSLPLGDMDFPTHSACYKIFNETGLKILSELQLQREPRNKFRAFQIFSVFQVLHFQTQFAITFVNSVRGNGLPVAPGEV